MSSTLSIITLPVNIRNTLTPDLLVELNAADSHQEGLLAQYMSQILSIITLLVNIRYTAIPGLPVRLIPPGTTPGSLACFSHCRP